MVRPAFSSSLLAGAAGENIGVAVRKRLVAASVASPGAAPPVTLGVDGLSRAVYTTS